MKKEEIDAILSRTVEKRESPEPLAPPTEADWKALSEKFGCEFGETFKAFMELKFKYEFLGIVLNVSGGERVTETIAGLYEDQLDYGNEWDTDLIPFYAFGNGDYFMISAKESPNSGVYRYFHEDEEDPNERIYDSFEEWLLALPEALY